jgi:hypothetical protein
LLADSPIKIIADLNASPGEIRDQIKAMVDVIYTMPNK